FFSSRRRHTRFSRDWSSDVCSSDLCPLQQAIAIAEKLRGTIANHDFALRGGDILLTASLGIAEYARDESSADFFTRADRALYQRSEERRVGKECRAPWTTQSHNRRR